MTDLDKMLATRTAIMDEIAAEITPEGLEPDEFTITQVYNHVIAQGVMVKRERICECISRRVASGELTMRWVRDEGRRQKAFKVASVE